MRNKAYRERAAERRERALRMLAAGMKVSEVARALGVSTQRVYQIRQTPEPVQTEGVAS